ncbi:MAG: tRNA 2-thiouridine(34) synthase MnmA [Deltaproteobacteria bacterium]|nr:tRNA 2-thiouridine(34) synthase MnmA [Deltaproteobacteria bacterium]
MSGGVDSSYTAYYLKQQGYDVVGMTMAVFAGGLTSAVGLGHACYGPSEQQDIQLAREVCAWLGIPHYTIDLKSEYKEHVVDYFVEEYRAGRTPNPCTRCNPEVKFGFLLQKARRLGVSFDRFATGHYARVGFSEAQQRFVLQKGVDRKKDQSYFLYGLKPALLPLLLFPLGTFYKHEVRKLAEQAGLPVAQRPESQDFVQGGDYLKLFKSELVAPGPIVDTRGNELGRHKGIVRYTVGQRRGLGVTSREPLYVVRIDAEKNAVVVGRKDELLSDTLTANRLSFVSVDRPEGPLRINAKIRYRHKEASATLIPLGNENGKVVFDQPQVSITPGQSVVFYRDELVLGGGEIKWPFAPPAAPSDSNAVF